MAVIRSKRLWIDTQPLLSPETTAYTVPAGKRAIIRSMAAVLHGYPSTDQNAPAVSFWVTTGGVKHKLWWAWFLGDFWQPNTGDPVWSLARVFDGNFVMHAGDSISWLSTDNEFSCSTWGSGHELNEMA